MLKTEEWGYNNSLPNRTSLEGNLTSFSWTSPQSPEQEEYEIELEAVEDVFLQEREALLGSNKVRLPLFPICKRWVSWKFVHHPQYFRIM